MNPLEIRNLSFAYGQKPVLKDLSFEVKKGAFCGLLGPNGAGKSTLFSLLTGLLPIPSGHIFIDGLDIAENRQAVLSHIGIVFQQPTLELDMSVEQNMRYFAALHGMAGKAVEARVTECLELVKINERRQEKVRALNGGHRRRMEIARALIHRPTLLLLDEATVGLDVQSRKSIVEDTHALTQEGISVLWATHLVDEIWPDDAVIIIERGEIRAQGRAKTLAKGSSLLEKFIELTENAELYG